MAIMTTEKEWLDHFEKNSIILHPENSTDSRGRPLRNIEFLTPQQHLFELLNKKTDSHGWPLGRLEQCKSLLSEARDSWQYFAQNRGFKKDKKPIDKHAEKINRLTAQKKVLEKEARFLNSLLDKQTKNNDKSVERMKKKFRYRGTCKLSDGEAVWCDFRKVKNGKFVDDGTDLKEYLVEVKRRGRAKAQAIRKVERDKIRAAEEKERVAFEKEKQQIEAAQKQFLKRRKK